MLFFYYGEDSFRAKQKIKAIVRKFHDKVDQIGQNIQYLDGENIKAENFFQAVSVMGFLADKKLIIIKNIFNNKKLKDWQDALIEYLGKQADTPEENYIIFWQTNKPDTRLKLYKALNKLKFTEEFTTLSSNELSNWIKKQVNNSKKTISNQAIDLLINYVGNDLWQLNNEINKLVNFVKAEITDKDVKDLVQAKVDDNIFNLIDALGNKDKPLAMQLIEEKLACGVNHQYILTMIIRQFRLLIKAKALGEQASHSGALMSALRIPRFIADKTFAQSKLYDLSQLKQIYKQLLYLDEKFKTSTGQEKILFTQIINHL